MSDPRKRSRQENQIEMHHLRKMYDRLPPDKKAAQHAHMQKRMSQLQAAIDRPEGAAKQRRGSDHRTLQTALLVVLVGLVALGVGFFGVAYLAKGG